MKTFKVYYHHNEEGYKAVKVGVSFPAFFFTFIWFFYRGADQGLVYLLIWIFYLVMSAPIGTNYSDYNAIQIIVELAVLVSHLVAFIKGNEWVEEGLEQKYYLVEVIQANNPKAAIAIVENSNSENVQDVKDKNRERKRLRVHQKKIDEQTKKRWAKEEKERKKES